MAEFTIGEMGDGSHRLLYQLIGTDGQSVYKILARADSRIVFNDVMSNARIAGVSEPIIRNLDAAIYPDDGDMYTANGLIQGLKRYAADPIDGLQRDWDCTGEEYKPAVGGYVEYYLNQVTNITEADGLVLDIGSRGKPNLVVMTDQHFLLLPDHEKISLCLAGAISNRSINHENGPILIQMIRDCRPIGAGPFDDERH